MRKYIKVSSFEPKDSTPFNTSSEGILYSKVTAEKKAIEFEKEYHRYLKETLNLTKSAISLLNYLSQLNRQGDIIIFDINDALAKLNLTAKPQVYACLSELMIANVIAPSKIRGAYYFNPTYFNKVKKINLVIETILK